MCAELGVESLAGEGERRVFPGSERLRVHLRSGWAAGQGAILTGAGAVGMGKTKLFTGGTDCPNPASDA